MSGDSISGTQTPTPLSGWNSHPNLRRRLYAPAKGRGRLQRQIARCFALFGPEVSASRLLDWCYARDRRRHRWSMVRILRQIADRIGRAPTIGRPWIWRLRNSTLPADLCQPIDNTKDKHDVERNSKPGVSDEG